MNVKQALSDSKQLLRISGVPSYALDAELLLMHVLQITREKIIGYPERAITSDEADLFGGLIKRRAGREPLSHILGRREFFGREFKVTKDTLDPRPDSESLIEAVFAVYPDKDKALNIIDFGTGTGCLLLTLLAEYENAKGTAVDISEPTLAVAKENSVKLGLAKRADFIVSNWGEEVKGKYDLIISNPPYIKKAEIEGLEPEVSIYEPGRALDGGDDGLKCYKDLAPYIASLISDNGFAVIELGVGQDESVKTIMENVGLTFITYRKDLAGINRCIVCGLK